MLSRERLSEGRGFYCIGTNASEKSIGLGDARAAVTARDTKLRQFNRVSDRMHRKLTKFAMYLPVRIYLTFFFTAVDV